MLLTVLTLYSFCISIHLTLVAGTDSKSVVYLKLTGGITELGAYKSRISVGTPQQMFDVLIDTGSSTLILPSTTCTSCKSQFRRYDEKKSTTSTVMPCYGANTKCKPNVCNEPVYKQACACASTGSQQCCSIDAMHMNDCGFFIDYGDGSNAQGFIASDLFEIGDSGKVVSAQAFIGVITSENQWTDGVDGLMGLAFPTLDCTPTCVPTVFNSISSNLETSAFSMCFVSPSGQ